MALCWSAARNRFAALGISMLASMNRSHMSFNRSNPYISADSKRSMEIYNNDVIGIGVKQTIMSEW